MEGRVKDGTWQRYLRVQRFEMGCRDELPVLQAEHGFDEPERPQGKGGVSVAKASEHTRQRQCLSHEGKRTHAAKAAS